MAGLLGGISTFAQAQPSFAGKIVAYCASRGDVRTDNVPDAAPPQGYTPATISFQLLKDEATLDSNAVDPVSCAVCHYHADELAAPGGNASSQANAPTSVKLQFKNDANAAYIAAGAAAPAKIPNGFPTIPAPVKTPNFDYFCATASPTPTPTPGGGPTPTPGPTATPGPTPTPVPTVTPTPSPTPTSTPAPGVNTAPAINSWPPEKDVSVGDTLQFVVKAFDAEDDNLIVRSFKAPKGAVMISQGPGADAWEAMFEWKPTADQANRIYDVTFKAFESPIGNEPGQALLKSLPRTTSIRVFPADTSATEGFTKVLIKRAQWQRNKQRLVVSGAVKLVKVLTATELGALLVNPVTINTTPSGVAYLSETSGAWQVAINGLTNDTVPCEITAGFMGENSKPRKVRRAPSSACNK